MKKRTTSITIDSDTDQILRKFTIKLLEKADLGKLSFSRVLNLFIKATFELLKKMMNANDDEVIEKIVEFTEI